MATAIVNGVTHGYDEAGTGPPLLLLHAGIADRRMWDDVMPALARAHRVIRFDMRGYGETPLPDGPFAYTADAAALLEALGVFHTHVIGVSMGAGVAMDLALARPEMVDRLVLVAPGLASWDWDETMSAFDEAEEAALGRGDLDEASWLNVRFWLDGPHRGPNDVDAGLRTKVFEMQRRAFEWENPAAEGSWLIADRHLKLDQITAPTLIVTGELDQPDFAPMAEHIGERVPEARVEVMPEAAHLPPMETPDAFSDLVFEFLSG